MASIKGVSLKAIKKTVGIEGEGFTANIYLNGKKVGEFVDYADGSMGDYFFTDNEAEKTVICTAFNHGKTHPNNFIMNLYRNDSKRYEMELERVKQHFSFVPEEDMTMESISYAGDGIDTFFYDIYELKHIEDFFKKMIKKGYIAVGIKDSKDELYLGKGEIYAYPKSYSDEDIYADGCSTIFKKLSDFNII